MQHSTHGDRNPTNGWTKLARGGVRRRLCARRCKGESVDERAGFGLWERNQILSSKVRYLGGGAELHCSYRARAPPARDAWMGGGALEEGQSRDRKRAAEEKG